MRQRARPGKRRRAGAQHHRAGTAGIALTILSFDFRNMDDFSL